MKYAIRKNGELSSWLELYDEDMFDGQPAVMKFETAEEAKAALLLVGGDEIVELEA